MANKGLGVKIIALRKQGMVYNEIKKTLKCSKGIIAYHCKGTDLVDAGKKLYPVPLQLKKDIAKYCKTHTDEEAKNHFKVSFSVIYKYKNFKG